MLLTKQEEQLKRREEHFPEIFNKDDSNVGSRQKIEDNNENEVNLDPPTKTEIQLALSQLF